LQRVGHRGTVLNMSQKTNNVPLLRFGNFKDSWNQQKLNDFAVINPDSNKLPEQFIYIDLECVNSGELLFENTVFRSDAPSRAQRLLEIGDVLFQMVRPYQKNNYYFNKIGDYVASTGYAQIRTDQDSKYLYQYIHFQKFVDRVIERCTGTSYPAINSTDLSNIPISFPSLPEQQKIASFLTTVDEKLQALKKKKTLLEQYKKGVMQKIFSQEIRFRDDNGKEFPEWEEKTLGDCLNYEQPTEYLVTSTDYDDSYKTPVLTAGKTFILGYTNETNGIFNKRLPVIIFDDFTTAIQFVSFPFKAKSSAMKILIANSEYNIKYLFEAMKNIKYEIGGHERHWISKFSQLEIQCPCFSEQTKIANFLSAIDDKINHCQTQIEKTEMWKKGLLQRMFC